MIFGHNIYIGTVRPLATFQLWHIRFLPGCLKQKSSCTVQFGLSKRPVNQFKPVHQSRQQTLRAFCPNIYFANSAMPIFGSFGGFEKKNQKENKEERRKWP